MRKYFVIFSLCLVFLCSGCNFNVYNPNSNKNDAPTTLINTSSSSSESDLADLYNNCKKAVVTILNYASYYDKGQVQTSVYGSGSGFIYAYDDDYIYLYTNAHVVDVSTGYNQSYYEIVFYDGYRSYGYLTYSDASEDVAIMRVEQNNQDYSLVSVGNSNAVNPGESVFAVGSPLGLDYKNTVTSGIVSNVQIEMIADSSGDNYATMYMIQIDAALNPGNSGGPLFNYKGEVIGVNTMKLMRDSSGEDVESFNFAIPINHFVTVANSLTEIGEYSRPKLGITIIDIVSLSLKQREEYGITVSKGLYIESVSAGSASYNILKSKEIIVKINDVEIESLADFSCELYKYYKNDKVSIVTTNTSGGSVSSYSITLS